MFQESLSSAFWFLAVWGPKLASVQPEVTILNLGGGLSSYRRTQRYISDYYVHFLRKNQDPASSLYYCVVYGCESWTMRKTEPQRTDAFKLQCWRRLLRGPWTARRSNQSVLYQSKCSLEGLMLKLKCQYFGHLMRRADSYEKTLMLGKIEGRKRRG